MNKHIYKYAYVDSTISHAPYYEYMGTWLGFRRLCCKLIRDNGNAYRSYVSYSFGDKEGTIGISESGRLCISGDMPYDNIRREA